MAVQLGFSLEDSCFYSMLSSCDNVLRPLHHHLQSSALPDYHVLEGGTCWFWFPTRGSLNTAVHTSLIFQLNFRGSNEIDHYFSEFLPLLKLYCSETYVNKIVLFSFSSFFIITMLCDPGVLLQHYLHHPKDHFLGRQEKSLLYLCFPLYGSSIVFWHNIWNLCHAFWFLFIRPDQISVHVVLSFHPHVKPHHLQPEEQWYEGFSEENTRKEIILRNYTY